MIAVVSWRSSVSEVVWKGAPAPAFLRLYTIHTRNTIHSLEMEICIVCAQYRQQLGFAKPPVITLNAVSCEQKLLLSPPIRREGVVWRSRCQLLVAQLLLMLRLITAT